tara:strand:- start:14205 stop:14936 length:732 start_codon:yes stop_codon:yes gene_type:complete
MGNLPKILVGTMTCGEGDITECLNAINSQTGVNIEHFIIEDKTELEAHNLLWGTFEKRKNEFDLIVKIDGDTVLIRENILSEICDIMFGDDEVTGMQVLIDDYFTGDLIAGLNCFKPTVVFNPPNSELYCDRVDTNHKKIINGFNVPKQLIPAAKHCHYSTNVQAFHFGLHRRLKNQGEILQKVFNLWQTHQDTKRGYVLIGAMMASNFMDHKNFSYNDEKFINHYNIAVQNVEKFLEKLKTS